MNQIVNPYIAGSPVTGPEMFFGRQDVFDFVRQTLTGKHRDQVIVLYGRRRTGKTSVLYQMRRYLSEQYLCIFVDLHGLALDSLDGFLWELANHMRRSLRRDYQIDLPRLDKSEFMADARGQFEEHFLNQLWSATGERHALLMLDEAVRLQEQVQAGKLELGIFEYLRHLMQHYERLNFLFSLGSGLEQMEKQYALLFNVALYKKISFLEQDAAVALISEPVQEYFRVAPAAIEHILNITSGHPYYTQLICHSIFNRWQKEDTKIIGVAEVDAILEEVVERGLAVLKYVWEESKPAERAILAGMAAAMGESNRPVTLADITQAWSALDVVIPRGEAVKAIRSLTSRDVIAGDDAYEFRVDLLHRWLLKYERLDWVKEELAAEIDGWQKIEAPVSAGRTFPRWAALPLILVASITLCMLGVLFSPTIQDVLPFFGQAASAPELLLSQDNADEETIEGDQLVQNDRSGSSDIESDGRTVFYFNDFNDYDLDGFQTNGAVSIGEVDDEVALILAGQPAEAYYFSELYIGSYELTYDQYLDYQPASLGFTLEIYPPNDESRYIFRFTDKVHGQHLIEGEFDDYSPPAEPHSLRPGWNKIRLVVDDEASTIALYTNNDLIMTIDDALVEKTTRVELNNNNPTTTSVIDNFLLQSVHMSNDISDGEEVDITTTPDTDESASDDQGVLYFNDFNDYDPDGFDMDLNTEIADVAGEIAIKMVGPPDFTLNPAQWVTFGELELESYELHYDLYLDLYPSVNQEVGIGLIMPDDSLQIRFFFGDDLTAETLIGDDITVTDQHHEAVHKLHIGWNEVRIVVNGGSDTIDLYTNGDHIISIEDIDVGITTSLLFEVYTTGTLSAIDNILILSGEPSPMRELSLPAGEPMEMVYVPRGSFHMGSDPDVDPAGNPDELPAHEVHLDGFWIGRTEVTNAHYNSCVEDGNCEASAYATDPNFSGGDFPVVGVSWNDAKTYCEWVGLELPTEAQWEYAARGDDGRLYPWGNELPTCDLAQLSSACGRETVPVVSFSPAGDSWVGAQDMSGNVSEWVADWYDEDGYDNVPQKNPTGPATGERRVLRGGAWSGDVLQLRSAKRGDDNPSIRNPDNGFRCADPIQLPLNLTQGNTSLDP